MEGKGYALTFIIVIAIICGGVYVAVSALRSNTQPLVRVVRPTEAAAPGLASAMVTSTPRPDTPTPLPPTDTPQPPIAFPTRPGPTATSPGGIAGSPPTPTPTVSLETPTPHVTYPFVQDGPVTGDYSQGCRGGAYIFGEVRDAHGNPLAGVHILVADSWGNRLPAISKGGADQGKYDVPISTVENTWNVTVTDAQGVPLSPTVQVHHSGQYVPGKEPCWHRLNWRRTY